MSRQQASYWAVLIGISGYWPNRMAGSLVDLQLKGPVADVAAVEALLRERLDLPADHIVKLTATPSATGEPSEAEDQLPSFDNMVRALKTATLAAAPGDQVVVYYSGHGALVRTGYPAIKGSGGFDEALAPYDVAAPRARGPRYLRDIEFRELIQQMLARQLHVTVILDCCHSGGATRGMGAVRCLPQPDLRPPEPDSLLLNEASASSWKSFAEHPTRSVRATWHQEGQHSVLLAACGPHERAYEYSFAPDATHGVFTYWLLDSLRRLSPDTSYKALMDEVTAQVFRQFRTQTPQLYGGNWRAFGAERANPVYAINVLAVDGERVLLQTGRALGAEPHAVYGVYTADNGLPIRSREKLAVVTLSEISATESWATVVQHTSARPIAPGAQAVLSSANGARLPQRVRVLVGANADSQAQAALAKLTALISGHEREDPIQLVALAKPSEGATMEVSIDADGAYAFKAGVTSLPLGAPLAASDPSSPQQVLKRLQHVARYRNVETLRNQEADSPLTGKVEFTLLGWTPIYEEGTPRNLHPIPYQDGIATFANQQWGYLRICNLLSRTPARPSTGALHVAVLALQTDWSIQQFIPGEPGAWCETVYPGTYLDRAFQVHIPPGYAQGLDILKLFAVLRPLSFRTLELPAMGQEQLPAVAYRSATDPLEAFLRDIVGSGQRRTRSPDPLPSAWTTLQIPIRVIP